MGQLINSLWNTKLLTTIGGYNQSLVVDIKKGANQQVTLVGWKVLL